MASIEFDIVLYKAVKITIHRGIGNIKPFDTVNSK